MTPSSDLPVHVASSNAPRYVMIVDDDEDDRLMIREAFFECAFACEILELYDGAELLDYLHRRGRYAGMQATPEPAVILLDLNMPKVDGRIALKEIKSSALLRHIPVVVLTTSNTAEDIRRSYELGASSFIHKPIRFDRLVEAMRGLGRYWFDIVELPVHR
jgi:CheY-like chemotaxis protein